MSFDFFPESVLCIEKYEFYSVLLSGARLSMLAFLCHLSGRFVEVVGGGGGHP